MKKLTYDDTNDINDGIEEAVDRTNGLVDRVGRFCNSYPTKDNLEKLQHDLESLSRLLQSLPR